MRCKFLLGWVAQACRGEERLGEDGRQISIFVSVCFGMGCADYFWSSFTTKPSDSTNSLRWVSTGAVSGFFLRDWLYLTGASIPQLANTWGICTTRSYSERRRRREDVRHAHRKLIGKPG